MVDSKLSYNLLLRWSWLSEIDAIPYTIHGWLKFEFQGEVHIVIGDPKPYILCNVVDFEELTMTCLRYVIVPLDTSVSIVKDEI